MKISNHTFSFVNFHGKLWNIVERIIRTVHSEVRSRVDGLESIREYEDANLAPSGFPAARHANMAAL